MYITIDFDGTVVTEKWPDIGRLKFGAKWVINKLSKKHTIIINTLREDKKVPFLNIERNWKSEAREFLTKKGVTFHFLNENPLELIEKWGNSRKLAGDVFIDDKNILPLTFWPLIYVVLSIKIFYRKLKKKVYEYSNSRRNSRR